MNTGADAMKDLKPCPFCGAGTTQVVENGKVWMGMKYSEPASVSVRHWCEPVEGQPARMIERVGRDHESANAAWNRRPQVEAQPAAVAGEAGQIADEICREVAELPDRNSPEDWPDAMLVTHPELRAIVLDAIAAPAAPSVGEPITPEMVEQAARSVFEFKPWPGHLYRFAGALNDLLKACSVHPSAAGAGNAGVRNAE